MARRIERVNTLLRQEISSVLSTEVSDPRLSSRVVSILKVDTSSDLRHARVSVSVLGGSEEKASILRALRSASGFIRQSMMKNLSLKTVPSLDFQLDESIEKGTEVLELIRETAQARESQEDGESRD